MTAGVLFAFFAYASFAFGDAVIKGFGDTMSVFQIGFFVTLFSFVPALIVRPRGERWRDFYKLRHPGLVIVVISGMLTPGVESARTLLGARLARFGRREPRQADGAADT